MLVAGCDPSSRKVAVVVDHPDGRITTTTWSSRVKKWEPSSCLSAHEWVVTMFGRMDRGTVVIEQPAFRSAGVMSTVVQAFVSGAVQAAFLGIGWDVQLVNISTWKKAVVGSGSASKDDIAVAVREQWGPAFASCDGDGDLIDAAAICLYGRHHLPRDVGGG